jgi:hypothetical protein
LHRLSTILLGLGVSAAVSCGSPAELDRSIFPVRQGSAGASSGGTSGAAEPSALAANGCPLDITVLFKRPLQQGGCNDLGCHSPGNTSPDLISPNPAERLLGVTSHCNGRPYIGPDDSFLRDKLTGTPPECGAPMPFNMPEALSASDEACIMEWIEQIVGG